MSVRSLPLAGLAVLMACGPNVTTQTNPSIPVPVGATYEWVGTANVNGNDPVVSNEIVQSQIKTAIEAQMAAKGYKKVVSDPNAMFYVRYYIGTKTQTSYMTTTTGVGGPGYGYGWGGYYGGGVSTTTPVETTEGNVIVDLVQMGTNTLVWRGTMTGQMSNKAPTQQRINEATKTVMAGMPPAGGVPQK
jgi:hypothetical protein